jgi:hypothetical protein
MVAAKEAEQPPRHGFKKGHHGRWDQDKMRTITLRLYYGTAIVLVVAAVPIMHFWTCMANLRGIDHSINCPSTVRNERTEGNIDPEGNWITNRWLAPSTDERMRCPSSGKPYVVPRSVGQHPYCLTHGHLVELSGFTPHSSNPRFVISIVLQMLSPLAIVIAPLSAILVFFVRRHRKTKRNPNNTSEGIRRPADGAPKPSM